MSSEPETTTPAAKKTRLKPIILECVLVGVAGLAFSFIANQVSPRGLALGHNNFPGGLKTNVTSITSIQPTNGVKGSNAPSSLELQLKANGLQLALSNQVIQFFNDPRYAMEQVVFVDARDDEHYTKGHIPGAYQFDHYRKENYLGTVLPPCTVAEQVVVYCTGGECEDSQSAAMILRDGGIGREKLFVYAGGINEWISNALPVEIGVRKSGVLRTNSLSATHPGGAK